MKLSDYETRYNTARHLMIELKEFLREKDTAEARLMLCIIEDCLDAVSDYICELKTSTIGTMHRRSRMRQEARFNLLHANIVATSEEEEQTRENMVMILTERINELEQQAVEELERERETSD